MTAIQLKKIMNELCDKGSAIFFSTHVLDTAEKLCNKVAMIHQGRIAFAGTMEDMLKKKVGGSLEEIFMEVVNHEN